MLAALQFDRLGPLPRRLLSHRPLRIGLASSLGGGNRRRARRRAGRGRRRSSRPPRAGPARAGPDRSALNCVPHLAPGLVTSVSLSDPLHPGERRSGPCSSRWQPQSQPAQSSPQSSRQSSSISGSTGSSGDWGTNRWFGAMSSQTSGPPSPATTPAGCRRGHVVTAGPWTTRPSSPSTIASGTSLAASSTPRLPARQQILERAAAAPSRWKIPDRWSSSALALPCNGSTRDPKFAGLPLSATNAGHVGRAQVQPSHLDPDEVLSGPAQGCVGRRVVERHHRQVEQHHAGEPADPDGLGRQPLDQPAECRHRDLDPARVQARWQRCAAAQRDARDLAARAAVAAAGARRPAARHESTDELVPQREQQVDGGRCERRDEPVAARCPG